VGLEEEEDESHVEREVQKEILERNKEEQGSAAYLLRLLCSCL
jgi:hypothetical protein